MSGLAHQYDKLTGDERFKLGLAALARGDDTEAAALGRTCPEFAYHQKDVDFSLRISASNQVATILALELAPHLALIRFLDLQAEYVNACLEILESTGFDSAIEAHWNVLDPGGNPSDRDEFPMPDLKALAAGAADMPYDVTRSLRGFWSKLKEHNLSAVASTLAGFNRFTLTEWAMTGPEALSAHKELFEDLEPYRDELEQIQDDVEAAKRTSTKLTRLWRQLLHQQQEGGNT